MVITIGSYWHLVRRDQGGCQDPVIHRISLTTPHYQMTVTETEKQFFQAYLEQISWVAGGTPGKEVPVGSEQLRHLL